MNLTEETAMPERDPPNALLAHRPEPLTPPEPGEPGEPDTIPDPTREPAEPDMPPIGDPPPPPNQAPHVRSFARM
jgi:hypothetical protein